LGKLVKDLDKRDSKGEKVSQKNAVIFSFAVNITYSMGLKPLDGYLERDYDRKWVIMTIK
jgi:hypothetical protein